MNYRKTLPVIRGIAWPPPPKRDTAIDDRTRPDYEQRGPGIDWAEYGKRVRARPPANKESVGTAARVAFAQVALIWLSGVVLGGAAVAWWL